MQPKKLTLKATTHTQPRQDAFLVDDENRIDWERRKKKEKDEEAEVDIVSLENESDDVPVELVKQETSPKRKGKSKKMRHVEIDEDSGRAIVKRWRKTNRLNEWQEDEYE